MPNDILIQEQKQNLLFNVSIIGWLGNIVSSATLLCSALTILHHVELIELMLETMNMCEGPRKSHMRHFLENFMLCTATASYVLSLVNILTSTMLLIGVARKSCAFIFPWLVYQGILFGVIIHLVIYMALSNLFVDFTLFVFSIMIFTMGLVIYFKIYQEVFMLFKLLKSEHHERRQSDNIIAEPIVEQPEIIEHSGRVSTV